MAHSVGRCLAACLAVSAAGACDPQPAPRSGDGELVVSSAISLRGALRGAADDFQKLRPATTVRLNTGASGLLVQQVLRGAPVDLIVSASRVEIDRLEAEGKLMQHGRAIIAANRMVVVVPRGSEVPETVGQLARPAFQRIAIGNPRTSPAGRYARQAIENLGLWQTLERRMIPAENARQALEYVVRGEVDAGLLYRTDARLRPERLLVAAEVPPSTHDPILYLAAVLRDAPRPELARRFLDFLTSCDGQRRLAENGFLSAPAE